MGTETRAGPRRRVGLAKLAMVVGLALTFVGGGVPIIDEAPGLNSLQPTEADAYTTKWKWHGKRYYLNRWETDFVDDRATAYSFFFAITGGATFKIPPLSLALLSNAAYWNYVGNRASKYHARGWCMWIDAPTLTFGYHRGWRCR